MITEMIRKMFHMNIEDEKTSGDMTCRNAHRKSSGEGEKALNREFESCDRQAAKDHNKFKKIRGFRVCTGLAAAAVMMAVTVPVYAAGAETVTSGFNTLFDIVSALVSSIGSIILLWGFFEWGTALQSQDGVMQSNAFKRIGGGLIMVLAPQLITAFITV